MAWATAEQNTRRRASRLHSCLARVLTTPVICRQPVSNTAQPSSDGIASELVVWPCFPLVLRPFSCLSMYRASAVVCQRKATARRVAGGETIRSFPKGTAGPWCRDTCSAVETFKETPPKPNHERSGCGKLGHRRRYGHVALACPYRRARLRMCMCMSKTGYDRSSYRVEMCSCRCVL